MLCKTNQKAQPERKTKPSFANYLVHLHKGAVLLFQCGFCFVYWFGFVLFVWIKIAGALDEFLQTQLDLLPREAFSKAAHPQD